MEIGPQPILTGAALQAWPESSAAPRAIACRARAPMIGVRSPKRWPRPMSLGIDPTSPRCTISRAAGSNYPPIRSSVELLAQDDRHPRHRRSRRRSGILGCVKDLASGDTVYTSRWSIKSQPWLAHHVIYGTVVVPGATYAAMALAAVEAPAQVREVFFYEPIILPEKTSREVQLTLHALEDGGHYLPGTQPPVR